MSAAATHKLHRDAFSSVVHRQRSQKPEGHVLCVSSAKVTGLFIPRAGLIGIHCINLILSQELQHSDPGVSIRSIDLQADVDAKQASMLTKEVDWNERKGWG